jgi:hypothetical protein
VLGFADAEDELFAMRDDRASDSYLRHKHMEFHVFVTNAPAETASGSSSGAAAASSAAAAAAAQQLSPSSSEDSFFGPSTAVTASGAFGSHAVRAPFSSVQLYRALKYPTVATQQFGDLHIHRGQPRWPDHFTSLSHRAKGQADVACIYTAGPINANATVASASYMMESGMPAASYAQILEYQRTSEQLKANCVHYQRQLGKKWRYFTDLDA